MNDLENPQQDLSRIKEILFGDELQGLDKRLAGLRNELMAIVENQAKTIEEEIAVRQKELTGKIEALQAQIAQGEKKAVGLGTSLQETTEQIEELKKELKRCGEENQESLKALKEEWKQAVQEMDKAKVNKTEIAELFGMMIQKLK